jgi:hypothetical protein
MPPAGISLVPALGAKALPIRLFEGENGHLVSGQSRSRILKKSVAELRNLVQTLAERK